MSNVDFGSYKRIVQALWDPEPRNDDTSGSPIWCLGAQYSPQASSHSEYGVSGNKDAKTQELVNGNEVNDDQPPRNAETQDSATVKDSEAQKKTKKASQAWPADFLDDCESRFWFTYRSSFPPIKKSPEASMTLSVRLRNLGEQDGFTSDTGWGCMIRSGQILLANALMTLRLGREWRRGQKKEEERRILAMFADDPRSPFSIHRFVEHGASACGKHPGEWFGPSATARCIQALSNECEAAGLKVYVNGDGADVYEDRFFDLAKSGQHVFTPTLILLQLRLGIDRITPAYWNALKGTLRVPQSVGIAGGRPASSLYFFATQGDHFFYLDPHFTRPALPLRSDPVAYTDEEVESCHTRRLRRIHLKDMDPSMLIAFFIRSEEDWQGWKQAMSQQQVSSGKAIVHVSAHEPPLHGGLGTERSSAVDDVETFDDDDDEEPNGNGDEEGSGELVESVKEVS